MSSKGHTWQFGSFPWGNLPWIKPVNFVFDCAKHDTGRTLCLTFPTSILHKMHETVYPIPWRELDLENLIGITQDPIDDFHLLPHWYAACHGQRLIDDLYAFLENYACNPMEHSKKQMSGTWSDIFIHMKWSNMNTSKSIHSAELLSLTMFRRKPRLVLCRSLLGLGQKLGPDPPKTSVPSSLVVWW